MGDMGGGGVKNLKKVRDVLCERPLLGIWWRISRIHDSTRMENFYRQMYKIWKFAWKCQVVC